MTVTDTTGPQLVTLPRDGYELFWTEDGHKYQRVNDQGRPGTRFTACSTVAAATPDRPDGLMTWAENTTLESVLRLIEADHALPHNVFALRNLLEGHELRWKQIRDKRGAEGTNVHKRTLEALAKGEEIPDLDSLSEEERGYGQAVFSWWMARQPGVLEVEQQVLSLDHSTAGRFDLRGEVSLVDVPGHPCLPGITLVDLKTSKQIRWKDHVQLAGYDLMARECGIGGSDQQLILQVDASGNYIEHEVVATAEDFLTALANYRGKSAGESRMRKMEKLRERGE